MLSVNFSPFPEISTERLNLREVALADNQEVFALRTDDRVMEFLDRAKAKSVEEADKLINSILADQKSNTGLSWAISFKDDPRLLGTIGFWRLTKEHFRAEIGYSLLPDYWGKGIMQEAMEAVIRYGFESMKIHSIEANVNPDNQASIRLLERNGFVREAYFRENYYFDGAFLDSSIYSLVNKKS